MWVLELNTNQALCWGPCPPWECTQVLLNPVLGVKVLFDLFFLDPLFLKAFSGSWTPIASSASRAANCSACFLVVHGTLDETVLSPKQTKLTKPGPWKWNFHHECTMLVEEVWKMFTPLFSFTFTLDQTTRWDRNTLWMENIMPLRWWVRDWTKECSARLFM